MAILFFVSIFLAFLYIFIISHILTAWNEITEWETSDAFKPETKVSIVIPFRNEEKNIVECVRSALNNNYPKALFDIIAVDDHSSDDSLSRVRQIESNKLTIYELVEDDLQGKKAAISYGVKKSKGDLIVTLDADCKVPKNWLRNISSYYEYNKKIIITGMVKVEGRKNNLEYFQIMDTCGTMGLHAAGIFNKTHFLANGANLIFEKQLFESIKPYDDNIELASGDDIFFVNKVAETNPDKIGFLKCKETVVETQAENTWSALWNQRIRWASKNNRYSKGIYKWMTAVIWLFFISIIMNFLLIPVSQGFSFFVALIQLLILGIMDFLYLQNMCKYFNKSKSLERFIPGMFVHLFYVVIAGFAALLKGKYVWKDRRVR